MKYRSTYSSPLGEILLAADETGLCGLWFKGQKYYPAAQENDGTERETAAISDAKRWLNEYFSAKEPDFTHALSLTGTDFQMSVWRELLKIPYGKTATYGEIAARLGTSSRAVGSAVGHNPISIIVPCHRVLGADGSLTGYAAGTEKKKALLELEHTLS